MPLDLFDARQPDLVLGEGAVRLSGFALGLAPDLIEAVGAMSAEAPFRRLTTPGGYIMSVAMTNCGEVGWVSDRTGYRYDAIDPERGRPWPHMPAVFFGIARRAAEAAGFQDFRPDACLVNRYEPGARLSLHQDRDEKAMEEPIVSVSLGLPAIFLWGGRSRGDKTRRIPLVHGDVVVWGGPSRLAFHGVAPLAQGHHPATGSLRYNLTFRRANPSAQA